MSRGLGRVQRGALAALREELKRGPYLGRLTSFEVAARVYGVEIDGAGEHALSDAQRASMRRALLRLCRLGLVHHCGFNRIGRARWQAAS